MWKTKSGFFLFESEFPIEIGYILHSAGNPYKEIVFLKQIHSNIVVDIDHEERKIGDGLYTKSPGIPLGIRVADCLPIYFFDAEVTTIGILHAGWQGTLNRIGARINQMFEEYYYIFGPAIGRDCYEIGPNLALRFKDDFGHEVIKLSGDRYYLDLKKANEKILEGKKLGDLEICTHCDLRFSSFRRDGNQAGRDIAFITLLR